MSRRSCRCSQRSSVMSALGYILVLRGRSRAAVARCRAARAELGAALMTPLPPLLQGFFTERLARQRDASPHTVAAYRDCFRLLLVFLHDQTGQAPSKLALEDINASMITAFLWHLENERGNSVRTRNARLTAIHSFFHYAALKAPECSELIARVLAIPRNGSTRR